MNGRNRLEELRVAAKEYFAREKNRVNAEHAYLDSVFQGRGSAVQLEESNLENASTFLVNSLQDYLNT